MRPILASFAFARASFSLPHSAALRFGRSIAAMPTYVLMTKLSASSLDDPKGRREAGKEWKKKVAAQCPGVKWIAHYALLGPYDFIDIYDAPDQDTAFRVSLLSRELGALSAESWPAISYDKYLPIVEAAEKAAG
jgi:uncharacterized protein with GYD domain